MIKFKLIKNKNYLNFINFKLNKNYQTKIK